MYKEIMSSLVDEVLCAANLPPRYVSFLRNGLRDHYEQFVLDINDDYPYLAHKLYEFNDNEMYSIVSLSFVNKPYVMFLIARGEISGQKVFRSLVTFIKDEHIYERENLGAILSKVSEISKIFQEMIASCTRTSRKAVGVGVKDVELPSREELQRFYECERKVRYLSLTELENALQVDKQGYLCHHCGTYHQGSSPTGEIIPAHIMYGRWVTTWRRKNGV
jgi:hypothetical protein